jgi:hypothetical protein
MDLTFVRGDRNGPRGHAIVFFRPSAPGDPLFATYLVVPPFSIDLSRLIPPILAGSMDLSAIGKSSAIPLPPIADAVPSLDYITQLAELRDDDLVDGGAAASGVERVLQITAEAAQSYFDLYSRTAVTETAPAEPAPSSDLDVDINEVMYSMLGPQAKVTELAKLVGQLRYAVDGQDKRGIDEAVSEIERIRKTLPESYRIGEMVQAARNPDATGQQLANLYLERCYLLASEKYDEVRGVETAIETLRSGPAPA